MSNLLTPKELEARKKRYQRYKTDPWNFSKAHKSADDVGGLLQHIEELEKAMEQAVEATEMRFEAGILTTNGDRFPSNDDCPDELANYLLRLRTKEAGSGEGK